MLIFYYVRILLAMSKFLCYYVRMLLAMLKCIHYHDRMLIAMLKCLYYYVKILLAMLKCLHYYVRILLAMLKCLYYYVFSVLTEVWRVTWERKLWITLMLKAARISASYCQPGQVVWVSTLQLLILLSYLTVTGTLRMIFRPWLELTELAKRNR